MKKDSREYRSMPLMTRRAENGEEKGMYVEGYATTFEDPYVLYYDAGKPVKEIISRHALDDADMTDVIMLYDHEGRVFARNSNGTLELSMDDHGLFIRADLSRTELARGLLEDITAGMVTRMSWCFVIEDEHFDEERGAWVVDKVGKVYDVSAVSIPADQSTEISAARKRKMDGEIRRERAERLAAEALKKRAKMLELKMRVSKLREG